MDTNIDLNSLDRDALIAMIQEAREAAPVAQEIILDLNTDAVPVTPPTGQPGWGEAHIIAPEACLNVGMQVPASTVRSFTDRTAVLLAADLYAVIGGEPFTTSQAWDACGRHMVKSGGTGPRYASRNAFGVAFNRISTAIKDGRIQSVTMLSPDGRSARFIIDGHKLAEELDRVK